MTMDQPKAFIPPEVGADGHIIRRLGWALVKQWATLPEPVRDRLQKQAVLTDDAEDQSVQLNEQISIFLREHG
jgi:hypothetical protein